MPKNHVYATAYNKLPVKTAVTRKAAAAQFSQCERRKKFALQIREKEEKKNKQRKTGARQQCLLLGISFRIQFDCMSCCYFSLF